jgi:hypothetical protein
VRRTLTARFATGLLLLALLGGCHDWATGTDALADAADAANDDGGLVDVPPDRPPEVPDDGAGDGEADGDGAVDALPELSDDAADDAPDVPSTCGNGIVEDGEDCERDQLVECTTSCGTRASVSCSDDCRIPPPDDCPTSVEVCNGQDDDCNGRPDDGTGACPDCEVFVFGSHVYHLCGGQPWLEASTTCRSRGMHLVTIDDDAENEAVSSTAAALAAGGWWMGYNDRAEEGTWVWDGPSPTVPYDSWAPDQPDDGSGNEDCGQLLFFGTFWNDDDCAREFPYVCEYP